MSLDRILNARSVAVVGASRDEGKRGYQAIRSLIDSRYEGAIYPINPRQESILGLRCAPSIADVEGPIDLALVTTPATTLPAIVEQCGAGNVAGMVVIAGGFGELGADGRRLQERVVGLARDHGVRILGPNTSGLINVHSGMNLVGLRDVPKGDLALLSQSGNMALHVITEARLKSMAGFSYYVGVGNEADIRFHEYLEFFAGDEKTRAVVAYVEGLGDGRRFLQAAHLVTRSKPVVLLKGGRSASGSRSAGSHTGALAGISAVAHSAFERAGIIVVERSDELFPVSETLASLPAIANDRVAVLADGGGHATLAADVLTDRKIALPKLGRASRERLAAVLSPNATLTNPVDVAGSTDGDPAVFAECARILLEDPHVDGLLLVGLFGGYGLRFAERLAFMEEDAAHRMGKLVRETGKPIVVHSLYKFAKPHSLELLRYYGIPVFDSVDTACACIAALARYGSFTGSYHRRTNFVLSPGARAKSAARALIDAARAERRSSLLEHDAKRLLALHGAPVGTERLARDVDEAVAFAAEIDGPVVLKICSPDILHKSDAGGVRLRLSGPDAVRAAFDEIVASAGAYRAQADIRGCLVAPMALPGTEVIIGTRVDAQFGPVVMFGIGGVLVEVLKDVVFRVLPISRRAATSMVAEIRSAALLQGFRGEPAVDRKALVDLLMVVSEVVQAYPEIEEMDLNPVIARPDGISVVDARVLLARDRVRNGTRT